MKKNVIKLLIVSLIIFLLGVMICSAELIYAKAAEVNLFESEELSAAPSYEIKLDSIDKKGTLPLSTIEIKAEKADIIICSTDEDSRVFFENPDKERTTCIIENGILKIHDNVPFYIMGLSIEDGKTSFAGFRNVFSKGLYSHTEKSVKIYLNEKDKIDNIKISLGIGDIEISEIDLKKLTVSSSYGDAELKKLNISETADITLKKGNVTVEDSSYVFVNAVCTLGDIAVYADGRKTNCETTLGDITVKTANALSNYNIRASLTRGQISLDGIVLDDNEYSKTKSDAESLWLKTAGGDISIYKSVTNE